MNKSLLILIGIFALAACRPSLPPAMTGSPAVSDLPTTTANLSAPTLTAEIPYPPPPVPTNTQDYPYVPPPTIDPNAPTPLPNPTATPKTLDVSGVWYAKLLNDQQGWVLSGGNLLWTDDTGQHWRQMTPPGIGEGYIQNAFFLDPEQAWVLVCNPEPSGGVVNITYTSDGGNTWEVSRVTSMQEIMQPARQYCGRVNIFFLNAQNGWVLVDTTQTMNSHHGEMFQTLDGGQTWQHLDTSPSGDFFFVSDITGWMSATCCTGGAMQLYRTEDGGGTWERVSVNGSDDQDDLFLPFFFDQRAGILAINLRNEEGFSDGVTFFKTQDGGENWESIGQLSVLPPDTSGLGSSSVEIWNEQTWVMTVPNDGVFWTLDGGQSWIANTNESARLIFEITLGSASTAWGLKCDQGGVPRCLYLVITEDIGVHWAKVEAMP